MPQKLSIDIFMAYLMPLYSQLHRVFSNRGLAGLTTAEYAASTVTRQQ